MTSNSVASFTTRLRKHREHDVPPAHFIAILTIKQGLPDLELWLAHLLSRISSRLPSVIGGAGGRLGLAMTTQIADGSLFTRRAFDPIEDGAAGLTD